MVKITNGISTFEVTEGAYESIYKQQGFKKIDNVDVEIENVDNEIEEEDELLTEDEKFCENLLEKPIGSWNKGEVKKFAEIKGIDISGTKNPAEAKNVIKEFLAAE